jgi:predicted O-methyltransferase YrrM
MSRRAESSQMAKSLSKLWYVVRRSLANPSRTLTDLRLAHLARDHGQRQLPVWMFGNLPRIPLAQLLPGAEEIEVRLPRVLDRSFGTTVTAEEACLLCVIQRHLAARAVLEIGTADGSTTLALAANLEDGGMVTTVDLPPEFDPIRDRAMLAYPDERINLTSRDQVGRQFRFDPLGSRIRQVFGDSAALDWGTLGGPFDLIFIDGCHEAPYVRSDTANALGYLASPGAIVWHDYGLYPDVSNVVDHLADATEQFQIAAIEGTRLAVALSA